MTRLRQTLCVAPVFFVMVCARPSLAADNPPATGDWFRGQNPPLAPVQNAPAANLNGTGGADFSGPGAAPPPMNPPPPPARPVGARHGAVSDFPEDPLHDWVVASARYAYSRAMFHRAEKELDDSVRMAQFTFEQSKEYADAVAAEKRAYDAYTAERQKALESVLKDPKYVAAIQLRDESGAQIARLRAKSHGDVPRELVLVMASQKLQYASDAHAIEKAALDKDEALMESRRKMVDANSKVTALRTSFDVSVRSNPQILQARRNLEDSRVALITSEAYLNASTAAGQLATDYSYYRHRWDGLAGPAVGWNYGGPYGYGY